MPVNYSEVNEHRISEKTQEVRNYCSQRKDDMTPRAFELARNSLSILLDNIKERDEAFGGIPETIKASMDKQHDVVAECSEKQAASLARTIVYRGLGDDLNLYPVTADQKIQRSQARGIAVCTIPSDEMTPKDFLFVARAIAQGVNISKQTMIAVIARFQEYGFDPYMMRVYSYLALSAKPVAITSLPDQVQFGPDYRKAANQLVGMGYLQINEDGKYLITSKALGA